MTEIRDSSSSGSRHVRVFRQPLDTHAATFGKPDGPRLRRWILERLDVANDPRVERYWRLVSTINN